MSVRSWARSLLVLRGRDCSDGLISGAVLRRIGFGLYDVKHSLTAKVCIFLMLLDIDSGVGGLRLLSMLSCDSSFEILFLSSSGDNWFVGLGRLEGGLVTVPFV